MDEEERIDPEIEALLVKYAGGRMPPLVVVDAEKEDPASALIDGDLLQIYHAGLVSKHGMPVGFLLPAREYASLEEKWMEGDYRLNEWSRRKWSSFCRRLRLETEELPGEKTKQGEKVTRGDKVCQASDREHAILAEKEGDTIAYMCPGGLIDFAVPILVKDQAVAVLFCGQFRPEEGAKWHPEFVRPGGFFRLLRRGGKGVDAWAVSEERMRALEPQVGLAEGSLYETIFDPDDGPTACSPAQVKEIIGSLQVARGHLSSLATSTYELEKSKVADWIRAQITGALVPLSAAPKDTVAVLERLSRGLAHTTRYFRLDYGLVLSCSEAEGWARVLGRTGLSEEAFPLGKVVADPAALPPLAQALHRIDRPAAVRLGNYKELPVFDQLHTLYKKKSKLALAVPLPDPLGSAASVMVLGRFKEDVEIDSFSEDDQEALTHIGEAVTLVAEVVLLVEQLKGEAEKQERFLEDVSHDIRTPVQTIVIDAEVLTRGLASPKEAIELAGRIAAHVRRLHRMSDRVWTLIRIAQGNFAEAGTEVVDAYEVIMGHRKPLLDLKKHDVQIIVDADLAGWPPIQVNRTLFSQAVLNLLDNAVKYSRKGTEVRVDGKRSSSGVSLSFVNRGIPVHEEDKERIFQRYIRSTEAQAHTQEGTGIGLAVVKAFLDHCGGQVEVKSVPVPGTADHVTEFKLSIPQRGW